MDETNAPRCSSCGAPIGYGGTLDHGQIICWDCDARFKRFLDEERQIPVWDEPYGRRGGDDQ